MVCASVWKDKAHGLSPVQRHRPYMLRRDETGLCGFGQSVAQNSLFSYKSKYRLLQL